jgi:aspartate aminotransferase
MVNLCAGKAVFIKTLPENSFKISPKDLSRYINSKTKVLILNSPSNPSGCVYSKEELEEIAKLCVEKKIFVISDEIYEKLIYDNLKHYSIGSFNQNIYDLTITVNGLSKSHSMTGWRIGYLGGPPDIVGAISKLQDHSTSNPTSISQKAAAAALSSSDDFAQKMCQEFQGRRDYLMQRLSRIKKMGFVKPEGAFYIFSDIAKTKLGSAEFAGRLLEEMLVAVIPGDSFGRDDYVRLSFAPSLEQLTQAMDRIEQWVGGL